MNKIIINGDDFGLNENCSKAITQAFKENLISSTTAIANGAYIEQAYTLACVNKFTDKIGIHINLTEGVPLTESIKSDAFFCENGEFHGNINRLKKPTKKQLEELKEEVTAQVERLKSIGFKISHADSHHHIHTDVFFEKTIKDVLFAYGINRIRIHRNFGDIKLYKKIVKILYNRALHRQGFITADKMGLLDDLIKYPDTVNKGICDIMVHPDYDKNGNLIDTVDWDEQGRSMGEKLQTIKDYVSGCELISYRDL